jgi:amino-acid N-acetyltransferase
MKVDTGTSHVRPATGDDLPAIERLLLAADLPVEGVAAALPEFVVVDDGTGVVGAAGLEWHGDHALLRSVVVASEARGHGHGRAMIDRLLAPAGAGGAGVYLLTTTAARYFAALGFVAIDRNAAPAAIRSSPEFASICPADATVMHRDNAREGDSR